MEAVQLALITLTNSSLRSNSPQGTEEVLISENAFQKEGNITVDKSVTGFSEKVPLIVAIQSSIGLIPNFVTLLLVFQRRKMQGLHYLNANLACVTILILFQGMMYFADTSKHSESPLCPVVVYIRNCLINLTALTVLAISHERIQGLRFRFNHGLRLCQKLDVGKVLYAIWGISLSFALPTLFSATYVEHEHPDGIKHSACIKGPLFGSLAIGVVYEAIRCVIFHIILCGYLIYELYKIRRNLKYFYFFRPVPSRKLRKVRKVRFIFINSLIFVLIWLPFGMLQSIYTPIRDRAKTQHFLEDNMTNFQQLSEPTELELVAKSEALLLNSTSKSFPRRHPWSYYIFICLAYAFVTLMPVSLFWTHNSSTKSLLYFWFWVRGKEIPKKSQRQHLQLIVPEIEITKCESTTVAGSPDSPAVISSEHFDNQENMPTGSPNKMPLEVVVKDERFVETDQDISFV